MELNIQDFFDEPYIDPNEVDDVKTIDASDVLDVEHINN